MGVSWEYRNADPGFGYAGGFQDILTAFNGLNHRGANVRYKDNQALLEEQINHLIELKKRLEEDEGKFFQMFGIQEKNKKECFRALQRKLSEWDATGAGQLINDASIGNTFYIGLEAIKREAVHAEITQEVWDDILYSTFQQESPDKIKELLDKGLNIGGILNDILNKPEAFSASARSTLVQNLTVKVDEKGDIKIVSDKDKISPSMQKKLIKLLKEHLKDKGEKVKPNYNFVKMFDDLFSKLGINGVGQTYIRMALREKSGVLNSYAFNSNDNQIKGFLGEVYNNAFLMFMASNGGNKAALERITPTGITEDLSGQDIFIDTWLDGFGIQVKNYEKNKVMKQGFKISKSYTAGYFIKEVLQLNSVGTSNTASVGDILLNFFTAYAYNKDYSTIDPSVAATDGYRFWRQARDRMEDKFKDSTAFHNILMPYVDKLIGIDRALETKDGMFVKGNEYRNTFFNISGNYIPSSVMVQAIIDTIQKKADGSMANLVTAHFSAPTGGTSGPSMWSPDIDNTTVGEVFAAREDYANASRLSYTITLDVDDLVANLLI